MEYRIFDSFNNREDYEKLKKIIDYHMDRYYNNDNPEISDYEYDQLMINLKKFENIHPDWVTPDSPSQKIGGTAKREAGVKVTHNVPMLSIEDVFTKEDVSLWIDKVKSIHPDALFSVETKIDGLSVSLEYKDGKLVRGSTRGNGIVGENITENASLALKQMGYDGRNRKSVVLTKTKPKTIYVAVTNDHKKYIAGAKVISFEDLAGKVLDPYGQDLHVYLQTAKQIEQNVTVLLDKIKNLRGEL